MQQCRIYTIFYTVQQLNGRKMRRWTYTHKTSLRAGHEVFCCYGVHWGIRCAGSIVSSGTGKLHRHPEHYPR